MKNKTGIICIAVLLPVIIFQIAACRSDKQKQAGTITIPPESNVEARQSQNDGGIVNISLDESRFTDFHEFDVNAYEYGSTIIIWSNVILKDFAYIAFNYDIDKFVPMYEISDFRPEKPLLLKKFAIHGPGDRKGISFTNENGIRQFFLIGDDLTGEEGAEPFFLYEINEPQEQSYDDYLCKDNEEILLSFRMMNSLKIASLCISQSRFDFSIPDYIVFRYGTSDNIELEYPTDKEGSWNKFAFEYRNPAGLPDDERFFISNIHFENQDYEYIIYTEFGEINSIVKSGTGIRITNKAANETTDLKGISDSVIGDIGGYNWFGDIY